MFEKLIKNEDIKSYGPWSDSELKFASEMLGQLAPDFVAFVVKFGSANIGDGFFNFYSGIADLDDHLIGMGHEKMGLNAWIFGDGDGDMAVIEKSTGECLQIEHEGLTVFKRHNSFTDFLTWILRD